MLMLASTSFLGRRLSVQLLTVLIASIWWAGELQSEESAARAERFFGASLSASNQTVFTESPGEGQVEFELDLNTLNLSWTLEFSNLTSPIVGIHIHGPAQAGTNGPQTLELWETNAQSPVQGSQTVTEAQVQYMLQGWTYVSIHTQQHPRGEIRGKIFVERPPK